jgi:hypothetical protein
MKVLVLYRERSEHRQTIEELIGRFKNLHPKSKVEVLDIDHRDGMAMASLYDVTRYPAVLTLRDDGTVLQTWQGTDDIPRIDDISYYVLDQG